MATEVESQNSNHRLSQIISETFNFLEGEDDGTTNGNDLPSVLEREFDGTASGATSQPAGLPTNGNDDAVVNGNRGGTEGGVSRRRQMFEVNKPTKGPDELLKLAIVETSDNRGQNCKETGKKTLERIALWEQGVRSKSSRWDDSQDVGPGDCSGERVGVDEAEGTAPLLRPPSTSGSLSSSGSFSALSQGSDRASKTRDSGEFCVENCDNAPTVLTEGEDLGKSDCVQIESGTPENKTGKSEDALSLNISTRSEEEQLLAQARVIVEEVLSYESLRKALQDIQNKSGETTAETFSVNLPHIQGQTEVSCEGHRESDGLVLGVQRLNCGHEGSYADPCREVDTGADKVTSKPQATSDTELGDDKVTSKPQATSDLEAALDNKVTVKPWTISDPETGDYEVAPNLEAVRDREVASGNIGGQAQATNRVEDMRSSFDSINPTVVGSESRDNLNTQCVGDGHSAPSGSQETCNAEGFIQRVLTGKSEKENLDGEIKANSETRELQETFEKLVNDAKDNVEPTMSPTESTTSPVVLRRKKSDAKQPNGGTNDGKNSPTASPGTLKRRALRSPLSRLRPVWDYTDIPSDGDSPRQSEDSDDDDDAGIYADSYRNSQWFYLGGATSTDTLDIDTESRISSSSSVFETSPETSGSEIIPTLTQRSQSVDPGLLTPSDSHTDDLNASVDSGLGQSDTMPSPRLYKQNDLPMTLPRRSGHVRSDSISTTASEIEFRRRYQAKTKRIVHRQSSTQTYQRMSERFYDEERCLTVVKRPGDSNFGFHIKGSNPVAISTVEADSAAEAAGVKISEVVISINDVNVLDASHQEAIKLISQDGSRVKLTVASDSKLVSDRPLCSGFLVKQGGSGLLKNWRRRWFVLKNDHCLYYYKAEGDKDPLGAILLTNYTITKAPEMNRKHTFKAHKYGQRTYYFQADSDDDMTIWANAMSTAAMATAKTDTWLDVSSHNVGLPALSIKSPDCHGYLTKMGNRRKNWKRRYCVLKDACLYYYLEGTSSTAQGVAHLHGYQVDETLPFNKKFGFTLIPPDSSMRTFYFFADNETDMKRWLKALQKSIGRWVRADDM